MPGTQLNAHIWITEYVSPYDVYHHGVTKVLASNITEFQSMAIVEIENIGKALVLDGKWQSCTWDEFLYHEPLVHPACVNHGNPRKVLVLGAGEGATVREVLKWNTVEKVVMVDIDGEVVEECKKHLPEMHQGAFNDPRTEVVIGDALTYLDNSENEWDVIISDLSDPIEEGPSFMLFTKEYFEKCRRALKPDGYLAVQAGPLAPREMALHVRLVNTVKNVFPHVASYGSHTPSYCSTWGFILASEKDIITKPDPEKIDALLKEKTTGNFKMFDGTTLVNFMHPPKHIRDAIARETRVYTITDPPKFFGKGVAHT
jgi:spermidine synthase